jgi:hypothetical protein
MPQLNETHDAMRRSWVESANLRGAEFPIQTARAALGSDSAAGRGCQVPARRANDHHGGRRQLQAGMATHIYLATKSMEDERF